MRVQEPYQNKKGEFAGISREISPLTVGSNLSKPTFLSTNHFGLFDFLMKKGKKGSFRTITR
jgi:hypothetical protein